MNWFFRRFRNSNPTRLEQALQRVEEGAEQFRRAAEELPAQQARVFWDLAAVSTDLRDEINRTPGLINPLRKIIFFYLPKMAELSHRWARLSAQDPFADLETADQAEFFNYLHILQNAVNSCQTRQQSDLEQMIAVFQTQLGRLEE